MRAYRKWKRDAGLKNVRRWEPAEGVQQYSDHRILDARSLAMRPKDLEFVQELVRHDMINKKTLLHRLKQTDLEGSRRHIARARLTSFFKS